MAEDGRNCEKAKTKGRAQLHPALVSAISSPRKQQRFSVYQSGRPLESRKLNVSRPIVTDFAISAVLPSKLILAPTTVTLSFLLKLMSYCFMNEAGARWTSMLPVSVF